MIQSFQTTSITTKQVKMNVIFLGDMSVGKSSIIQRYVKNTYQSKQNPTVGLDRMEKITTCNSVSYKLTLWDTAGQQRFRSMIPGYLKMGKFCIVVFDVTNRKSFQSLQDWISMYLEYKSEQPLLAIFANKVDLQRQVTKEQGKATAKKLGYPYFQVSALSGDNIQKAFNSLIKTWGSQPILLSIPSRSSVESQPPNQPIELSKRPAWDKDQRLNCCHI